MSLNRIDMIISKLNYGGVLLANAVVENGMQARLIIIGKKVESPFSLHSKLETKFLGIERSNNVIDKILYPIRVYFILSNYLSRERSKAVFVWGKEFTAIAEIIRITLMRRFKLVGVNVNDVSGHLNGKNIFIRKILKFYYKSFLSGVENIICQSSVMAEIFHKYYNIPLDKISTIYPALQPKFFNPSIEYRQNNKILFIGKLTEHKNPLAALEILKNLENNSATLTFIGEGELEAELKEKTAALGLERRVSFAGRQNDILPFLKESSVLILTSKYEGFGIVLAEAIACGIPVIAFNCPTGPAEIIIDGVNGYLIHQGNIEMFAKKIDKALTQQWDHARIAQTAKKFHPDNVIKHYMEVIKKNLVN